MRTMATMLMAAAWLFMGASPSDARIYPWCAVYNDRTGSRNCGFNTWEQCMATVSGIGGFCSVNPMFQPGAEGPRRRVRRYQG